MMKPIADFEKFAQRLVEDSFARLLGNRLEPLEVATAIAHALEDSQLLGFRDNCYRVHLNPVDLEAIQSEDARLSETLTAAVGRIAQQSGLEIEGTLQLTLVPDDNVPRRRVEILRNESDEDEREITQIFKREPGSPGPLAQIQQLDAFLIVQGKRHVPLDRPVINLGRRTDNDIVIDLSTVSRQHAQIRWRYGRFVIYDLASRGGTSVNGVRVKEAVLHSGDVIKLSDAPLIYGEGLDDRDRLVQSESGAEQPTQTMPIDFRELIDGG